MSKNQVTSSNVEALLGYDEQKELAEKYGIRLLEKIDEGAFGVVFKGTDLSEEGSLIAVKVTQHDREKYSSIEKSILSGLNHPNIVKFKKFIEAHSNKYIVMEYIGNGNLCQLIEERRQKKNPFTESEISQIMLNLLLAVKCMHENNVIHRDIKPENILLGSKEDFSQLKVSDFGLSVKYQDGAPFRSYSQCCGTVSFMAPEILLDKQYSKPIDIWSCGIILYMLFTMGKHPFKNSTETREEYVKRLISLNTSNKTPSTEIAFAKTPLASDLFPRMVAKEPLNRYTVSQVLKHPFITRKLDTIKAIMVLQHICGKVSRSNENNFKLNRIPRPPTLSLNTQFFTSNINNNQADESPHPMSSAVSSPQPTDKTQLRCQKILFRDEPSNNAFTDCGNQQQQQQKQQQQAVLYSLQLPSRSTFSVDFSNSPQAIKTIPSRTPGTPNQERKYARNHPNISSATNSIDFSRAIQLQLQQPNQTPNPNHHHHHLLSLHSIAKSSSNTPLKYQQQQQFFPETLYHPQQQLSMLQRTSLTPKTANLAAKIAQLHGSRAERLRSLYQPSIEVTTLSSLGKRNTQNRAVSLQRTGNISVPTTPSQSSTKSNYITAVTPAAATRKATFQIKFLNSQPSSLNATPTNNSRTTANMNTNNSINSGSGVEQQQWPQQIPDNSYQTLKSPGILPQSTLQKQPKLSIISNTNIYSYSNSNSPSAITANHKANMMSFITSSQPIVCHTLTDSTEDTRNTPLFSTHSHHNNNLPPYYNSSNSNSKSIDSCSSVGSQNNNNTALTSATFHQGYGQSQTSASLSLTKSHSQSNLLDLEAKKSKETYKRSHFSNQPFKQADSKSRQYGYKKPLVMLTQGDNCTDNSNIQQEVQKNFEKIDSFNLECGEKI